MSWMDPEPSSLKKPFSHQDNIDNGEVLFYPTKPRNHNRKILPKHWTNQLTTPKLCEVKTWKPQLQTEFLPLPPAPKKQLHYSLFKAMPGCWLSDSCIYSGSEVFWSYWLGSISAKFVKPKCLWEQLLLLWGGGFSLGSDLKSYPFYFLNTFKISEHWKLIPVLELENNIKTNYLCYCWSLKKGYNHGELWGTQHTFLISLFARWYLQDSNQKHLNWRLVAFSTGWTLYLQPYGETDTSNSSLCTQ